MNTTQETKNEPAGVAAMMAKDDDVEIKDWIANNFSGDPEVRLEIRRKSPKVFNGQQVGGLVEVVGEKIDEEELKQRYGGGTYTLTFRKRNTKGIMAYAGSRDVQISGPPVIMPNKRDDGETATPIHAGPDNSIVSKAMGMAEKTAEQERERAAALQDRLMDMHRAPVGPSPTDKILEKMIDGESARITALRDQHDTELRIVRERTTDDVKRTEDRMQRTIDSLERTHERQVAESRAAHERELANMKSALEHQLKISEISYVAQVKTLEGSLATCRSDLELAKKEIVDLRNKKEAPPEEALKKMMGLSEMLEKFRGGKDDDDIPGWAKVVSMIGDHPAVQKLAGAAASRISGPQAPQQRRISPEQRAAAQRHLAQRAAQVPQPVPEGGIAIDRGELEAAVKYLEAAARNGTDPDIFAQSMRSVIPPHILEILKLHGPDPLLQAVELEEQSPLRTQQGRNFVRRAVKVLVGDPAPTP